MTQLSTPSAVWKDLADALQRNGSAVPTSSGRALEEERAAWQRLLDEQLFSWSKNPNELADDGIVPPNMEALRIACQLVQELRDAGVPAPQRVAATGDGGLVFARQAGANLSTLEIDADGSVELAEFHDARFVSRQRIR